MPGEGTGAGISLGVAAAGPPARGMMERKLVNVGRGDVLEVGIDMTDVITAAIVNVV